MQLKTIFSGSSILKFVLAAVMLCSAGCTNEKYNGGPANQQDELSSSDTSDAIANHYPDDAGIENDPNVLYVEKFDDGIVNIAKRYTDVYNAEGMYPDSDVVADVPGSKSLKITNIGGKNTGGHLFRNFPEGFDSTVYIRYYVKYPSISKDFIHHEGIWTGGYNPSTNYPNPRAGICGLGSSRISIAYEPVNSRMGTYLYWGDMQGDPNGNCWGSDMVNGSSSSKEIPWDQWTCVEIKIKLNNDVSGYDGELKVWQNGKEVGSWGPGFPKGSMLYGKFTEGGNEPFKGFRWRTDKNLKINYIWIEFYDDKSPAGVSHYIKFDNLVIAKKYIGPVKK
jgi:hypothetical protein